MADLALKELLGGQDGQVNIVNVEQSKKVYTPVHLSKEQDIQLKKGDTVHVKTPGGGGYGLPFERDELLVLKRCYRKKIFYRRSNSTFWSIC